MATTEEMNAMYRWTRYVYDLTRKYYLLGRDRLLRDMDLRDGDRVIEIGCGTARNLIRLAQQRPGIACYGLDVSTEMLATAAARVKSRGLESRIVLRHCFAEQLDHKATFGLDEPFDAAFFSYSLSMIPTWPDAINAAMANLKPRAAFYVVDFWDQADLPGWFRAVLRRWLDLFHVHHRPELLDHLRELDARGVGKLTLESVGGRYAYIAKFQKAS
jgi:S-adenosylmethionine-diacylgycerolhomoserine-N-methlytransferase